MTATTSTDDLIDTHDVVVIGGGPAGASTAGLLAKSGHDVLLLEREKFPRYHIGESLITGVIAVVEELGVRERLEALGFVRKYGGSLVWGSQQQRWSFAFVEGGPYPSSYQVRRADFDALLLTRARELGASVLEEATVKEVLVEGERVVGVQYALRGEDTPRQARAKLVVDASGQARVLGRRHAGVTWHEGLKNVAVWTYYQGCERLKGDEAGNILIENVPGGWFWAIPLYDGTMSIGYVTPSDHAAQFDGDLSELFMDRLAAGTELVKMTARARRVGAFRSARDWSYNCTRFHGPGWALVGDAAAFIDPLFSTGVALATLAARQLATVIDLVVKEPELEGPALQVYEEGYRNFLDAILSFVLHFYDGTRDLDYYYRRAQGIIDPERRVSARQDFVTLISGLSGARPIFPLPLERIRNRRDSPCTRR
ncbi:NAD(P)/FAD-dependent oxidoreductase [Nonomuraea sp. NPDC050404]|uniref:NAD(P)/FAD-dependent oxidoreductase n=1 Tax=Nonomuraea sp. NPDC050404 TaxID=3155783 RepID=UPI0033DF000B